MKTKKIGIFKSTILTVYVGALLFVVGAGAIACWAGYFSGFPFQRLYENGYEVEAEVVSVETRTTSNTYDNTYSTDYYCHYFYKSETGLEYTGIEGRYGTKKRAEAQLGKKIIITIEPAGFSLNIRKSEIANPAFSKKLIGIFSIITTFIFLGMFSLLMYIFHKDRVDSKLRCVNWTQGKVVKVQGHGLYRLTIQFQDDAGTVTEKKAYRYFLKKDVEFLQNKGTITVRTDGKRIGIDEERLKEKRVKKGKANDSKR